MDKRSLVYFLENEATLSPFPGIQTKSFTLKTTKQLKTFEINVNMLLGNYQHSEHQDK